MRRLLSSCCIIRGCLVRLQESNNNTNTGDSNSNNDDQLDDKTSRPARSDHGNDATRAEFSKFPPVCRPPLADQSLTQILGSLFPREPHVASRRSGKL